MPRKRDTASERLRQHARTQTDPFARALALVNDPALLGAAFPAEARFTSANWDDAETHAAAAHGALTIDDQDTAIRKAFETFGLDPKNPFDWRRLFAYFADAHFGAAHKGRGAPEFWTDRRLCQLLADFHQVKSRRTRVPGSKNVSDEDICGFLQNDSKLGADYPSTLSPKTLHRKLRDARDINRNSILRAIVNDAIQSVEAKLSQAGIPLTPKTHDSIRAAALKSALNSIAREWRRDKRPDLPSFDPQMYARARRAAGIGS